MAMKLSEVLAAFDSRIKALEHTVNDVLVKSLLEANDQYEYDQGLEAFRGAHPELAEMDPKLKALYGDDFDTGKTLYDSRPEGLEDENAWVAEEIAKANAKLDALVAAMAPAIESAPTSEDGTVVEETVETAPTEEAVDETEDVAPEEISEEQLAQELKAAKGE